MNFERFYGNLEKFAGVGRAEDGGITRLAFSKEYYESIEGLEKYAADKGIQTRRDKVGNLFFIYNPNNSSKFIMLGSHMDTVKSGGLYDGALGAITALEVLETIKENKVESKYGIIAVAFNAEEGSEMGGTFGSRTITGRNNLNDEGLKSKLKKYNLTIGDLEDSIIDFKKILCFLELHIEQGGVLEHEGLDIGVVDGIVGITRYNITINGSANHAGTTPMKLRNDPIKKLPKVLEKLYELADGYNHPFVMTVGDILVKPGMYNIIPKEAEILIEVRDLNQNNIDTFFKDVYEYLDTEIKDYTFVKNVEKPSVILDKELMKLAESKAEKLGFKYKVMSSGAGHDAKEISHLVPTSLIFVPSKDGISHSPKEFTEKEDLKKGINLIYEMVVSLSGGFLE
ncbi:hydantoinase/carbamoylase family amidase [Peptoniphilus porci]|uniref:hydantoinase/carbamoylase family amidase n=1 Tax=Peptoniphilus porci TaxID=2652280 RepID=UPI0009FB66BC|nr:hydantoinase/carbamoylase family amidase [Peptoniphilus porci]